MTAPQQRVESIKAINWSGRLKRSAATMTGWFIGLIISINLIPTESKLLKNKRPLKTVARVMGFSQEWNMFTGIPSSYDTDYELEARMLDGNVHNFGPMLPELSEFDKGSYRIRTVFRRMKKAKYKGFLHAYYGKANRIVNKNYGETINTRLRSKHYRTRSLSSIRNGQDVYSESNRYHSTTHTSGLAGK